MDQDGKVCCSSYLLIVGNHANIQGFKQRQHLFCSQICSLGRAWWGQLTPVPLRLSWNHAKVIPMFTHVRCEVGETGLGDLTQGSGCNT